MGLILTPDQLKRLTLDDLRSLCDSLSIEFVEADTKAALAERLAQKQRTSRGVVLVAADHLIEWSRQEHRRTGDQRYDDINQSFASLTRDSLL
jgi:hypothetical protein